jgi:sortase B
MGSSGYSNIASYQKINSDVMGWIKVPGTNINYPVLYNSSDVYYYMTRDLYKQTSKNGVIWADPADIFGTASQISRNTVLYGHNWTNYSANPRIGYSSDVMFAQLTAYHHLDFAKQYPYIYYSTADQEMTWVVFAAFYTDVSFNYIEANPSDSNFAAIISGAKSRSRHIFDVDVTTSDKILTLSTCTRAYGKSDQQRFVVMARLLRSGETLTAINVTTNPNPVLPNL